jgi:hypothetical protein
MPKPNLCTKQVLYVCSAREYEKKDMEKCQFYKYDNIGEPYRETCYYRREGGDLCEHVNAKKRAKEET